jgi:hypothetical protein
LVGTQNNNLLFSTVQIEERAQGMQSAKLASQFVLQGAAQGETRSHGFFYKPADADSGILGLPFQGNGKGWGGGWQQLTTASSGVVYLNHAHLALSRLGILSASANTSQDDACKASCADWYGNSRPIFVKGRIFALMGYELVEGKVANGMIKEVRRVNYAPAVKG